MTTDLPAQKAMLRTAFKQRRNALTSALRERHSEQIAQRVFALPGMESWSQCFVYISCGAEVNTHPIIDELVRLGKSVAVPLITEQKEMLAVAFESWAKCSPAGLGILTPVDARPAIGPFDVALTPGLAFTRSGTRLGFGAGYYDKWFSRNTVGQKIALAFDVQIIDQLPHDSLDVPVDKIVTESSVISVI